MGPLLFIILSWSLYRQVIRQPDLEPRLQEIQNALHQPVLWLVVLMMLLNWGLEARKWQLLVKPLENFSFFTAFKSVLAGCSITMLTPNRIGEYGGRIIYVSDENRLKAISHTILGSLSQLFITFLFGTSGLLYLAFFSGSEELLNNVLPRLALNILLYASVLLSIGLLLLYLRAGFLVKLLEKAGVLKRFVKYVEHLDDFSRKQLLKILFLSFLRYLVFIAQYLVLLRLFGVEINVVVCFWLLAVFYLVMVLAPTIGFTELPVRAAASVQVLQLYSSNIVGIQAASLGIWLINLVVPAIIGSLLIFGIKIMKEK